MNTLVVLFALVAAAAAKPGALAPLAYSSYAAPLAYAAPAPFLATRYTTPYIGAPLLHSAPLTYGAYGGHFIKKRSVAFPLATTYSGYSSYIAPTTYAASPLLSTYGAHTYSAPLYHAAAAPLAYSGHFIKKRSAPLAFSTYAAPFSVSHQSRYDVHTSTPIVSTYAAPLAYSSPLAYSHYF